MRKVEGVLIYPYYRACQASGDYYSCLVDAEMLKSTTIFIIIINLRYTNT